MEGSILLWIQENMRSDVLTPFFKVITLLGNTGTIWIFLSIFLLCIKSTRKIGLTCATSLLTSFIINNLILKNLFARTRPYEVISNLNALIPFPNDYSFPSGHTAASFAVATVIFLTMPKKYGIPALILAVLVSFSRLYLGVHYPTDVIFGMLSATIIASICTQAILHRKTK